MKTLCIRLILFLLLPVVVIGCVEIDSGSLKETTKQDSVSSTSDSKSSSQENIKKQYYASGAVSHEIPYNNGKINGVMKQYSQSGELQYETTFKDGKEHGVSRHYSKPGVVSSEAYYKDGERHGISTSYYNSGELGTESLYENGKRNGVTKKYYRSGEVRREIPYKDDKVNGVEKWFDKLGNLTKEVVYENDKVISTRNYKKDKLIKQTKTVDLTGQNLGTPGSGQKNYGAMPAPQTAKSGPSSNQSKLTEGENLFKNATGAIAALKKKVGGDKVMAIELIIYPTYIKLQIQDQKKKENVDAYEYRNGSVSGPFPVKLHGSTDQKAIDANTFNIDECDFTKVPFMVNDIQERLQLEGGKVTHIYLKRNLPFSKKVLFNVYMSGTRKDGRITYDKKGKIKKVWK